MEDSNEDELDRLAREELTKEAKRGAERAREIGAYGWVKRQGASTDKKFLGNVLVSTLRSNKRKHSRDHDHRSHRRKYIEKRDRYDRPRHSYHRQHHPPKLINGGYFRYNDQRKYSHTDNGKREEKRTAEKHERMSDKDGSLEDKQTMSLSDRLKDREKEGMTEEKSSEHEILNTQDLGKDHKKDFKNKKRRDDKKDREKKTAKERKKKEKSIEKEAQYIHSDEEKVTITCGNSDTDLISEKTCYKDTGQGHRKRNISSKSEEESLLEDIKKHKDSDDDKNPQEKIIEIFGDYLIEKKQKKKKNKQKSHKAKHKHKKHKLKHDKHDKAIEDS